MDVLLNAATAVSLQPSTQVVPRGKIPIHTLLTKSETCPILPPLTSSSATRVCPIPPHHSGIPHCSTTTANTNTSLSPTFSSAAPLNFSLASSIHPTVSTTSGSTNTTTTTSTTASFTTLPSVFDGNTSTSSFTSSVPTWSGSESDNSGDEVVPVVRASAPRRRWKPDEDTLLIHLVQLHGAGKWNKLAESFKGRNGRQVRLRWVNHLQPELDKHEWRAEEDDLLLKMQAKHGNKWALIAIKLSGRTDNSVKNRFKSLQRRKQRLQNLKHKCLA